ncbi:reverse transcriptase domain-containing protein [Sulfurimonas sp.]|uniref:reverse transcriptase domain-containing protein n=1 Tax=Sulfurimonas sp. TaxID=2022749 RepID=UPI00261C28B5|nr:reverse transcriptase domain-containing protein [Sulfurimonas sp.]MDD3855392.1 reverse transcriptase domain-containing protein [Sulfurimonas sp.]
MNKLKEFYLLHTKNFEFALWNIRKDGYAQKSITKKNGGTRKLSIPPSFTKTMQIKVNKLLQEQYIPPKPVHGFIKSENDCSKNIITNASQHTKKSIVINVDIEGFFDSINFGRVRGLFLSEPFNIDERIATRLAQLTVHDNKLPQGAPTSPIISNFICKRMDHNLIKLAKDFSLSYSRYADDITFSSYKINLNTEKIILEVEKIIIENGFKINPLKTRIQTSNHSQIVTGLKVNQKVNVSRKYVKQIRSMLYSWYSTGLKEASEIHFKKYNKQPNKYLSDKDKSFRNILIGKINFLGLVKGKDDPLYIKYRHTYFLLSDNFMLNRKIDELEELDINNLKRHKVLSMFTQIYNSILIFTEGETDIIYMKTALKFFQSKYKYLDLELRFCNLRGWVNVKNIHKVFYANSNNDVDLALVNRRKCISPHIKENLKFCCILDADDKGIRGYFNNQKNKNFYLIDEKNEGYIEKLIDKSVIINIIDEHGVEIKPEKAEKSTKEKLIKHLAEDKDKDDIFSIDNFIAYKIKLIKKTELALLISKIDTIDFNRFEDMFKFLEEMEYDKNYADELCCNSVY